MDVLFLKGTSASFVAPGFTPVDDVFYFLTDTKDLYLGSQKLTSAEDVAAAVSSIAANAAEIVTIKAELQKRVEKALNGTNGRSLVFNEADGGGVKFEHNDGTMSFAGVNDGGQNGLTGQLYTVKKNAEDKYVGTRLNMTLNGFYYTNGNDSAAYTADDEIATKGDVAAASGSAESKTVYVTETSGGTSDLFSKRYGVYQGATGSAASPVVSEKLIDIDIPKDMFVESGTVETVTTADVPYEGAEVGDKYIDLILANATSDHIYIPVGDLVDIYTTEQNATQIQLYIDGNNEISGEIVDGSVDTDALADGAVTAGKLAQSAKDLFDEAGAAADVLGTSGDAAGDPTVYGALAAADAAVLRWGSF